ADHIAAIYNVTRKLTHQKKEAACFGFWFSLGHASVVLVASLALAAAASALENALATANLSIPALCRRSRLTACLSAPYACGRDPRMATDYRPTVFLPQTSFPMRGDLPKREPQLIARWQKMELYRQLRARAQGREKFILHDGPPYANGHLHIGHALNKILKDVINRAQQMLGKDAVYVPGWDCHGLPIEWKIEEEYRARNRSKDDVPILEFRKECREFARKWIEVQRQEFIRLGVIGDWEHPYTTMSFGAEAQIAREIGAFLLNGGLYRGAKPVMWSVVEKTALAEAEIEYHEPSSDQVWVRFPIVTTRRVRPAVLANASVLIWTTTPWTLPGNRAVAFGEEIDYVLLQVGPAGPNSLARTGEYVLVAAQRRTALEQELDFVGQTVAELKGADLSGTLCRHPLQRLGYEFTVPLLPGRFVSASDGTGFVHIAPGHGEDDYELGRAFGVEVPETVADDGSYLPHVPGFAGRRVFDADGRPGDANAAVIAALRSEGALFGVGRLIHSYPHSWRSKAPLIFRAMPQFFISMSS
ncbi:MAG: class I tRNA ligase family protein, partial [Stellaceae bacterium]